MENPTHPLVEYAERRLDEQFEKFKRTGGGNWRDFEIAMMRYQQVAQVALNPLPGSKSPEDTLEEACLALTQWQDWEHALTISGRD